MEDKIEVGEFVRTKKGIIFLATESFINNNKNVPSKYLHLVDETVKHSKNIIDLIEEGDIVELVDVLSKEVIYIWDEEMLKAVKQDIEEGQTLKSILTHEQFNQNKYEVEAEHEQSR